MTVRWPRLLTPTHLSQILRSRQRNPLSALKLFKEAKFRYPNYHHNGPVYATMIDILRNSGRIPEMKHVLDQMKLDSCECKDSIFASAIKTYAKAGMLDEAISLFRDLPQFNCVNWTQSFNTLLHIMVDESKLEIAHKLFLENSFGWEVKSRIRCLNLVLDALCRINRSDLALQIFQEMEYQGCHPDWESYRILMKGLCQDRRLNEATHLLYSMFWRISQKGNGRDIVIYRTLLDALCDDGQVQAAVDVLGKVLKKGLKAPSRCRLHIDLSQCDNGEDIQAAKGLINDALIRGGVPSSVSYNAIASDLYNEGKISEANQVLCQMRERGFMPSPFIYEVKADALCREGRIDEAVKLLEKEMVEGHCAPTVKLYNIVVKGLCDKGKSELAVRHLEKMAKQVGCTADKETYSILVNGMCQEGKFVEASHVLEEMLTKSYWPCVDTCNTLIRGLCFMGRQYEAVMWLEEMVSQGKLPEVSVWHSLVSSACSSMPGNIIFRLGSLISCAKDSFTLENEGEFQGISESVT